MEANMTAYKDLYITKWLLQGIERPDAKVVYQRKERGMYFANFNEGGVQVKVEIGSVSGPPYAKVVIKLTSPGLGEVQIVEPTRNIFSLTKKYDTPEDEELAEAIKRFLEAVAKQHATRELRDMETEAERKQAIFHRLLNGPD